MIAKQVFTAWAASISLVALLVLILKLFDIMPAGFADFVVGACLAVSALGFLQFAWMVKEGMSSNETEDVD